MRKTFAAVSLLMLVTLIGFAQQLPGYHVVKKIPVGGDGGWDYIYFNAPTHQLFVSHGSEVVVVNTKSDTIVGRIPKTEGVHGAAVANELGRCFISNGRSNTISIVDLKTLKLIDTVSVGKNPDAILYDPFSGCVFTFNGRSNDATILDAKKGTVLSTLPLGGKPEFSVTDGKGRIFVNIEDKNEIILIDAKKMSVKAHWSLSPGEEPSGLAFDSEHNRLFSVCSNKMMVILNAETGALLAKVPIGDGVDGCAFDPGAGLAFSSNGDGTMTVVGEASPGKYSVIETVATQSRARTITVDPATHTLYLPTAEFGPTPAPTPERPRPRPAIVPGTFCILKIQR